MRHSRTSVAVVRCLKHRFARFYPAALLPGIMLTGCIGDRPVIAPPELVPESIVRVSDGSIEGKAGDALGDPLVVRVNDASGTGVPATRVSWRVTSGQGRFLDEEGRVVTPETLTSGGGLARIHFEPLMLGTTTVEARLAGRPDRSVTFDIEARTVVIHIWLWILGPDGSSSVTVPVGTPVEWRNWWPQARITSTSVPAAGSSFDSGVLRTQERFSFVPAVPGTWEFIDEVSGETGSVTAFQN